MMLHEVAYQLGMTVQKLCDELSYEELAGWIRFFEKRPVGWREDDRMFKLINTVQGLVTKSKNKPWDVFPSLYPIYHNVKKQEGTDMSTFQNSALFSKLLGAKGGVKLHVNTPV